MQSSDVVSVVYFSKSNTSLECDDLVSQLSAEDDQVPDSTNISKSKPSCVQIIVSLLHSQHTSKTSNLSSVSSDSYSSHSNTSKIYDSAASEDIPESVEVSNLVACDIVIISKVSSSAESEVSASFSQSTESSQIR